MVKRIIYAYKDEDKEGREIHRIGVIHMDGVYEGTVQPVGTVQYLPEEDLTRVAIGTKSCDIVGDHVSEAIASRVGVKFAELIHCGFQANEIAWLE